MERSEVWIVISGTKIKDSLNAEYEECEISAVYSSEELAKEHLRNWILLVESKCLDDTLKYRRDGYLPRSNDEDGYGVEYISTKYTRYCEYQRQVILDVCPYKMIAAREEKKDEQSV